MKRPRTCGVNAARRREAALPPGQRRRRLHAPTPLPEEGEVTIGRSSQRQRARRSSLGVAAPRAPAHPASAIEIEDLGSSNGMRVREQAHRAAHARRGDRGPAHRARPGDAVPAARRARRAAAPHLAARLLRGARWRSSARGPAPTTPFAVVRLCVETPPCRARSTRPSPRCARSTCSRSTPPTSTRSCSATPPPRRRRGWRERLRAHARAARGPAAPGHGAAIRATATSPRR